MSFYLHNTPQVLTMRFFSKSQVKSSEFCDLVDEKLPDDLFRLRGAELEIQEGDNTLNKDFAMAIGFNQITDQESANQVGKLLIANGPGLDPETILYYTKRLKNGPYGYALGTHIKNNFDAALAAGQSRVPFQPYTGNYNIDNDFVSYLQNKLGAADCFLTPANYFEFRGIYASLVNLENVWNYTTAPAYDTNNKETRGVEGYETANKMPAPFKLITGTLNLVTLGTFKKFLKLFKTEAELEQEKASLQSGESERKTSVAYSQQDIQTAKARQEASSDAKTEIADNLKENTRLAEFKSSTNPFQYTSDKKDPGNNSRVPTPPGTVGPEPKLPEPGSANRNLSPSSELLPSLNQVYNSYTFVPTPVVPAVSPESPYGPKSATYEDYVAGRSTYVSGTVHPDVGSVGTFITSDNFTGPDDKPIPVKVEAYAKVSSDARRIQVATLPPSTYPGTGVDKPPFPSVMGTIKKIPKMVNQQGCAVPQGPNVEPQNGNVEGTPTNLDGIGPNESALNFKAAQLSCPTGTTSRRLCLKGTVDIVRALTGNKLYVDANGNPLGYSGDGGAVTAIGGFPNNENAQYSDAAKRWYWENMQNDAGQKLFTPIAHNDRNPNFEFKNGDVIVFNAKTQPSAGGYGHAQIYLNGNWVSDHVQRYGDNSDLRQSGSYRDFTIYRLNDLPSYSGNGVKAKN